MSASVKTSEEGRGRSSVDVLNCHLSKSLMLRLKFVLVLMLVLVVMLMETMLASMFYFEFHCLDDNTVEDGGTAMNLGLVLTWGHTLENIVKGNCDGKRNQSCKVHQVLKIYI